MITIDEIELTAYPELEAFIHAKDSFEGLIADEALNRRYPLKLKNTYPNEQRLSVIEICAILGLKEQISYLSAKPGFAEQVQANAYKAFRYAAENGHLEVLEHLESKLSETEIINAIKAWRFAAFSRAARNGHLDVLRHLETKLLETEIIDAIKADYFFAFSRAARNGHLEVLKHLESKLSETEIINAIKAYDFYAFLGAARNGQLDVLKYLETKLSETEIINAIKAYFFTAFRYAAENGHLDVLKHLESKLSKTEIINAIKVWRFDAFSGAVENGQLEVLKHLETKLSKTEIIDAIKADDFYAFSLAARDGHLDVVNHLLHFDTAFAYAEMHQDEYGENYVNPFIEAHIAALRRRREDFENATPNGVFDVEESEARLCFYMIRNLIRRGVDEGEDHEALLEKIRTFLMLPKVRALAHEEVTQHQANELLRLALRIGNQDAATLLLGIPQVRELAERNNFYADEVDGNLDLRAITEDPESSMVALSKPERRLVETVKAHYQEKITGFGGIKGVMDELKRDLRAQYEANPATIEITSNLTGLKSTIRLPFEFEDFKALDLNEEDYQLALKAYYQHEAHTIYRYLSKPNYWMAPNASYVYVYEGDSTLRYATFEDYQKIIAPFYLAAIDENAELIDGYTLEGRKSLFFKQLAFIARAHNWDQSRPVMAEGPHQQDEHGKEIPVYALDKNGRVITEEFDDEEGDKPSCYSGVNRRLFQSVLGHGLFKVLTREIVRQELNEQVRVYFKKVITDENRETLKKAYEDLKGEGGKEAEGVLALINITDEVITALKERLSQKYLEQFDDHFKAFVDNCFKASKLVGPDFLYFSNELSLDKLLEAPLKAPVDGSAMFSQEKKEKGNSCSPDKSSQPNPR